MVEPLKFLRFKFKSKKLITHHKSNQDIDHLATIFDGPTDLLITPTGKPWLSASLPVIQTDIRE
jgi:hypothetical protein